jgi:hypothetical protein
MNMSKNYITRPRHRITSLFFKSEHKVELSNKISDNNSYNDSNDNQSKIRIHREKITNKDTLLVEKNRQKTTQLYEFMYDN